MCREPNKTTYLRRLSSFEGPHKFPLSCYVVEQFQRGGTPLLAVGHVCHLLDLGLQLARRLEDLLRGPDKTVGKKGEKRVGREGGSD